MSWYLPLELTISPAVITHDARAFPSAHRKRSAT
jgi:hypothetical protein